MTFKTKRKYSEEFSELGPHIQTFGSFTLLYIIQLFSMFWVTSFRSVEINNTDAEGRLVLGDGVSKVISKNPWCFLDFGGFLLYQSEHHLLKSCVGNKGYNFGSACH